MRTGCGRRIDDGHDEHIDLGRVRIKRPSIVATLASLDDVPLAVEQGADIIEVRMDLAKSDPLDLIKNVRYLTDLPIIATNRISTEGGRFSGDEIDRLNMLIHASEHVDIVDVELEAPGRDYLIDSVECPIIVSYHDLLGYPEDIQSIVRRIYATGVDLGKIAVTPHTRYQCLEILETLLDSTYPLTMIGLGDLGKHLRLTAPIYGSVLTYGFVSSPAAPGQLSVKDIRWALSLMECK